MRRPVSSHAILSLAFGLICAGAPAFCETHLQSKSPRPNAPVDRAATVVHMSAEQLLKTYPTELDGVKFSPTQDQLDSLLAKAGERVDAFLLSFPNTASKENVLLERLRGNGKVESSLRQNFEYLVQVDPDSAGIGFEEARIDQPVKRAKLSGYCLTYGYTGTPILLHSRRQPGSLFRYLGRQSDELHAHVIAFAQKPDAGNAIGTFRIGAAKSTPMLYQGLIWVDPQSYQIVRMLTDLLAPRPDIALLGHTTDLTFREVYFNSVARAFWLPDRVKVTIRWKGKIYRNFHRYSDYRLFTVSSFDKVEQPQTRK